MKCSSRQKDRQQRGVVKYLPSELCKGLSHTTAITAFVVLLQEDPGSLEPDRNSAL